MAEVPAGQVTPLVDVALLSGHLGYTVAPARAASASLLVAGWLREDTEGTVTAPLDTADPLWASAFQLMVLTVSNPEVLAAKAVGPTSRTWPVQQEIDKIRQRVRERAARTALAPRGTFPPAPHYPDPALPPSWPGWRSW